MSESVIWSSITIFSLAFFVKWAVRLICPVCVHVISTVGLVLSENELSAIIDRGKVCDVNMGWYTHVIWIVYRRLVQHLLFSLVESSIHILVAGLWCITIDDKLFLLLILGRSSVVYIVLQAQLSSMFTSSFRRSTRSLRKDWTRLFLRYG